MKFLRKVDSILRIFKFKYQRISCKKSCGNLWYFSVIILHKWDRIYSPWSRSWERRISRRQKNDISIYIISALQSYQLWPAVNMLLRYSEFLYSVLC